MNIFALCKNIFLEEPSQQESGFWGQTTQNLWGLVTRAKTEQHEAQCPPSLSPSTSAAYPLEAVSSGPVFFSSTTGSLKAFTPDLTKF